MTSEGYLPVDVIEVADSLLKSKGYTDTTQKRLDSVKYGIVLRRVPSAVRDRYFDHTQTVMHIFQVIVKREREQQAIDECCDIASILDGASLPSQNGSYKFIGSEVYTEPSELKLDTGGFVWTTRIQVEILRKA